MKSKSKNKAIKGRRNRLHEEPIIIVKYEQYDIAQYEALKEMLNKMDNRFQRMLIPNNIDIQMLNPRDAKKLRVMKLP